MTDNNQTVYTRCCVDPVDVSNYSQYNDTTSVPCRPGLVVPIDPLTTVATTAPPTNYRGPPGPPGPPVRPAVLPSVYTFYVLPHLNT